MSRLLVTGSQVYSDRKAIVCALADTSRKLRTPITLVHGDARGADSICKSLWESWHNLWPELFAPHEPHPAMWDLCAPCCPDHRRKKGDYEYCPTAGHRRNLEMVKLGADRCVTFSLANSRGTLHCARSARQAGIPVIDFGMPTT